MWKIFIDKDLILFRNGFLVKLQNNPHSSFDFVILGENIRSLFLAALLIKKNYHVLVLENNPNQALNYLDDYSIIPLSFLRSYSIPYSERSLKSKSNSAYIERFFNLEKYIYPRTNGSQNWIFCNRKQLGIVNHDLFNKFLHSLVDKEKNLQILEFGENIKIKKQQSSSSNEYLLTIDSNEILIPSDKIIIADFQVAINLGISFLLPEYMGYKYIFKINEILSDSINHYFLVNSKETKLISILPCSNFSIIELLSEQDFDNPLTSDFLSFLQITFDDSFENIVFVRKEITYKKIHYSKEGEILNSIRIIPDKLSFPFPVISNLLIALESIFVISSSLDAKYYREYILFMQQIADNHSKFNLNFFNPSNNEFINSFFKMMHGKDLSYINIISRYILQTEFKYKFKSQNLTGFDFKGFVRILTHSDNLEK